MKTLLRVTRGKNKQEQLEWLGMMMGIFVGSAVFGFIYETIFYCINDHMLLRRGTAFLPVIQLYGWGGLLVFLVSYDVRKHPWKVLLNSGVVCGLLELVTGYLLFKLGNGFRGWDYNNEIWNWGNIGGFVCFRSVAFFAVSGLLLVYVIVPAQKLLVDRIGAKRYTRIIAVTTAVVLLDMFYNDIIADNFHLPNALTVYEKLGWPHKPTF